MAYDRVTAFPQDKKFWLSFKFKAIYWKGTIRGRLHFPDYTIIHSSLTDYEHATQNLEYLCLCD